MRDFPPPVVRWFSPSQHFTYLTTCPTHTCPTYTHTAHTRATPRALPHTHAFPPHTTHLPHAYPTFLPLPLPPLQWEEVGVLFIHLFCSCHCHLLLPHLTAVSGLSHLSPLWAGCIVYASPEIPHCLYLGQVPGVVDMACHFVHTILWCLHTASREDCLLRLGTLRGAFNLSHAGETGMLFTKKALSISSASSFAASPASASSAPAAASAKSRRSQTDGSLQRKLQLYYTIDSAAAVGLNPGESFQLLAYGGGFPRPRRRAALSAGCRAVAGYAGHRRPASSADAAKSYRNPCGRRDVSGYHPTAAKGIRLPACGIMRRREAISTRLADAEPPDGLDYTATLPEEGRRPPQSLSPQHLTPFTGSTNNLPSPPNRPLTGSRHGWTQDLLRRGTALLYICPGLTTAFFLMASPSNIYQTGCTFWDGERGGGCGRTVMQTWRRTCLGGGRLERRRAEDGRRTGPCITFYLRSGATTCAPAARHFRRTHPRTAHILCNLIHVIHLHDYHGWGGISIPWAGHSFGLGSCVASQQAWAVDGAISDLHASGCS